MFFFIQLFGSFFKVWLNQHFFLTKAINCTVLKAKKGDANEILLSMSLPDDAFSAVL